MASYRKRNGKWEYRISYKDPITGENKVKSKGGFSAKPKAEIAAAEMRKKLNEGYEVDNEVSLKHYLKEWLNEYKKPTVRKNTFQSHNNSVANHILPYFKEIKLNKVKPIMYQKFINHLVGQALSKRTVQIIHGTMFNAMEKAVQLNKIEKNPCIGATIPNTEKKGKNELEYMESDKIAHFLRCAHQYGYIYYIFFKVLIQTGMRKGEAAALQWNDIDLVERTININKSLDFQPTNKEEMFGDTKTYHSNRIISIPKTLVPDLQFHLKWQNQNKLAVNDLYKHDLNLVLCREDGGHMPKSTLFNAFERILKRAEIPRMPIHALRDTHAVILLEGGADLKYVQKRLGHKNYQITADIYAHISKKLEKDNIDKYDSHMEKILK